MKKILEMIRVCRSFLLVLLAVLSFNVSKAQVNSALIDVKILNLQYDGAKDAITYDVQMKAGPGYVTGTTRAITFNLRYEIYFNEGVELSANAEDWTIVMTDEYGFQSSAGVGRSAGGAVTTTHDKVNMAMSRNEGTSAPDIGSEFKTIAHVEIKVTSAIKPIAADLSFVLRPYNYVPHAGRSAWWNTLGDGAYRGVECEAPAITTSNLGGNTYCMGVGTTALSVTATGTETLAYQWYSNTTNETTGGTAVEDATSASYTPSTTVAGTLYYYCVVTNDCGTATSTISGAITVTPRAIATDITLNGATICSGQTATLTPTTSVVNPTFNWYKDAALTALFHTGSSYTTSALTADSTFYVTVQGDAVCENAANNAKIVTVTVTPRAIATDITLNGSTICSGQTATLTPTTSVVNPTFNWYKDAALSQKFHTGSSYTTSALTADSTFYVTVQGDAVCENAANNAKIVTVTVTPRAIATDITLNGATICSGQTATLTPTTSVVNPTFNWYKDAALTALFHTGSSYTTSVLTADSTFYVTVQGDAVCENAANNAKIVTVTVTPRAIATDITLNGSTICSGQTATLTPTTSVVNPTFNWYKDAALSQKFHTGSSYTTSVLTADSTFYVTVQGDAVCENAANNAKSVTVEISVLSAPPRVTSPQRFCEDATVGNLQAEGIGIKWYEIVNDAYVLRPSGFALEDEHIYYAVQSVSGCESTTYSPVKVIIDSNTLLEAPDFPGIFNLCGSGSTLADIPTYGNTNIVWYDAFTGGSKYNDPATVILENGHSYFAAQSGDGTCAHASRTEVIVTIGNINPATPVMETPQQFCEGALVGNLAVPNNQIVWYSAAEGGVVLSLTMPLIDGGVYYAAQKAGDCESATRTAVTVKLTQYLKPEATDIVCVDGKKSLADIPIIGAGVVWYAADGNGPLPLSTNISTGETYLAAQTNGDCESERIAVTLTNGCYNPRGTIFPFVHIEDEDFDNQFITTVALYTLPPANALDKINYVKTKSVKLFETAVIHYNDTTYIAGTPKNPGMIGFFDNPGNPILWRALNRPEAKPDTATVRGYGDLPTSPIGQFEFKNVASGQYVIEVTRQGFLTRYGVVTIGAGNTYLGHREILGGDINGDLNINEKDLSMITSKYATYGQENYKWEYDLNGSAKVGSDDATIIKLYFGAYIGTIYEETSKFLKNQY